MLRRLDPLILKYRRPYMKAYHEFYKAVRKYDRIVVFRHQKPDYDAMGTQMGLYTFLKDNFPNKDIHYVGDNHVSFTPRLFPETESLPESYFQKPFLAIVVDVGDHSRIADPRYKMAETVVKFDHHPFKEEIGAISVLDLDAAAAAEIVVDCLLSFPHTKISEESARYFYMALVGDSGRFMYSSTSPHTFAIASALIATGIKISDIYQKMYEKKIDDLKVTAYVLNHFSVSPHGVAYYLLDKDVQDKFAITSERGKENVNLFSNIEGINAWCSITEDPNPKDYCWRVSIRSKKADISKVAEKWGGGGHAQASGARIDDIKDLDLFIKDLDDLFA